MTRFVPFLILLLSLMSCGKNSSSSGPATSASLLPLNPSDKPIPDAPQENTILGLDDKLITINSETHAPMNFQSQDLTMTFDTAAQKVTGHSAISFKLKHSGRPYFELKGTVKNVKIDGAASSVTSITDPDGQAQSYLSLQQTVSANENHLVEFDYELPSGRVTFTGGGVRFLTDMTDLNGKFFEYWGPVGFEEDQFSMNLKLHVPNATSAHKLYTNGTISTSTASDWQISFPNYYSKSSFYIHLTNQTDLPSKSFVYKGLTKDIPITVYGVTSALVNSAVAVLPSLFKELEGDYGAYPHDKFLAYLNDRSGGMEYVGATITSVASIDHELLHSWFARGVIPADGRSGWIDEAMASWRDYGYTRASTTLNRTATNLADFSPFKKNSPSNAYVDGRGLFAELDREFVSIGGLKKVMKTLFDTYKYSIITNEEFWSFLESHTKLNLDAFKLRYTLGGNVNEVASALMKASSSETTQSKHPTPLSEAEVLRLR